jgi:hypothetical protein
MSSSVPVDSVSLPASAWSRVLAISAHLKAKLNRGADKDHLVCLSLQQCFDVIAEDHIERDGTLNYPLLHRVIPDQILESAVELRWLEPAMGPNQISWGHREWLMRLLDGRIDYFRACDVGRPFGHEHQKPEFVVIPLPETDPMIQLVKPRGAVDVLGANDHIKVSEDVLRRGVEARGIPPESPEFAFELARAIGDLSNKYGRPVDVVCRLGDLALGPLFPAVLTGMASSERSHEPTQDQQTSDTAQAAAGTEASPTARVQPRPTESIAGANGPNRITPKELIARFKGQPPRRSYVKLAARIGISKDTIYAITGESRWVSDEMYELVARVCGCKPEQLHPRDLPRPERRR